MKTNKKKNPIEKTDSSTTVVSTGSPIIIDMITTRLKEGEIVFSPFTQVVGPTLIYTDYPSSGTEEQIKKYFDDFYKPSSQLIGWEYESVWNEGILNLMFRKNRVSYGVLFDKKKSKVEATVNEIRMFHEKCQVL